MTNNIQVTPKSELQTTSFQITNKESDDVKFFIEPWGDEFKLSSGDTFHIKACYPIRVSWVPEIVYYRNYLIAFHMYDGEGFYFELWSNGSRLRTSLDYNF